MSEKRTLAAIQLLEARRNLISAEIQLGQRRDAYAEAEDKYLNQHRIDTLMAVVLENIVILPRESWFDLKRGERFDFVPVSVLT